MNLNPRAEVGVSGTPAPGPSGTPAWMRRTGWVITGLMVLFMGMDGVTKLFPNSYVIQAMAQLQFPVDLTRTLGAVALLCTVLYAIPQTAVLGAILLTGYLGGATAANVRQENASLWFAVAFGVIAWLGIYLRDERVRRLVPWRRGG